MTKDIYWNRFCINHVCGEKGAVTDILVSRDGGIAFNALCVRCGKEFGAEFTMAWLISMSAIEDSQRDSPATTKETTKEEEIKNLLKFKPKRDD